MTRPTYEAVASYNGFIFPSQRNVRCVAEPITDRANRSNKYINYTVTIECIVEPGDLPPLALGSAVDTCLENIRQRLLQIGKKLVFTDEGFGSDIIVNGTEQDTKYDSAYGPHPKLLVWEPAGANRASHIIWTCEFQVPECSEGTPQYNGSLCEFTYDINWTINEGITTRSITGTIEIPAHKIVGSRTEISDTIDSYREQLQFPVPTGFQRDMDIGISRDKRTIEFRITDTQIDSDNPYFPGCRFIDATHDMESGLMNGGFRKWNSSISVTVRMAEGYSRSLAWFVFVTIFQSRLSKSFFGYVKSKDIDGNKLTKGSWHFPLRLKIRERLYQREISFTFDYWLFSSLDNIFATSGMFTPVPGSNWTLWNASLSKAHSIRGNAKMGHLTSDDTLIDLCRVDNQDVNPNAQQQAKFEQAVVFTPQMPSQMNSWMEYVNEFSIEEQGQVVVHNAWEMVGIAKAGQSSSQGQTQSSSQFQVEDVSKTQAKNKPILQARGVPTYYARMKGYAIRGGYKIPMPPLLTVGGVKATRVGDPHWTHTTLVPSDICPIYGASWDIRYVLDGVPKGDLATFATDGHPEKIL